MIIISNDKIYNSQAADLEARFFPVLVQNKNKMIVQEKLSSPEMGLIE